MTKEDKLEVLNLIDSVFFKVETLVKKGGTFNSKDFYVERIFNALDEVKKDIRESN